MKLFKLDNINVDDRYCRIDILTYALMDLLEGNPVLPQLEPDEVLEFKMDERRGGLELGDYVTTLTAVLPLRRACAEAIAGQFALGEHELIPIKLINAKGRVHSDDHVLLNPFGRVDCLNTELSDMNGDPDYPLVRVMGKWCLRAKDVPADRDLFRVVGVIGYIFSERLVEFVQAQGFTNFVFTPVTLC